MRFRFLDVEEEDAVSYFYNVETAKINYFHLDVNDGKFVDNNNIKKMKDFALKINTVCMDAKGSSFNDRKSKRILLIIL